jgi:predicted HD phosphohydrolase
MTSAPFASGADLERFLYSLENSPSDEAGLSELEHLLQCAEILRDTAPEDPGLQIAGLLHDIGFGMNSGRDHGQAGACALKGLMGLRVAELVRLHVDAKRFLVATDPIYQSLLSPVSAASLELQGGRMDAAEAAAFKSSPFFHDAVRLRQADDRAKIPGKQTASLYSWLPVLRSMMAG